MARTARLPLLLCLCLLAGQAQAGAKKRKAITTLDPSIEPAALELLLRPLQQEQLQVEADAWVNLLEETASDIARTQVAIRFRANEIRKSKALLKQARAAHQEVATDGGAYDGGGPTIRDGAVEELREAVKEVYAQEEQTARHEDLDVLIEQTDEAVVADEKSATTSMQEALKQARKQRVRSDTLVADDLKMALEIVEDTASKKAASKLALVERLNLSRNARIALVDRVNVVLDALAERGGDVRAHRSYVSAVSSLEVDVSDTTALVMTLRSWLQSPEGGIRWRANLGRFFLVLLAFGLLSLPVGWLFSLLARLARASRLMVSFVRMAVRRAVMTAGFAFALTMLEINIGPVLAVLGAVGFVVGLALQETLGNFAGGMMILFYRPFDNDDVVRIGGIVGKVDHVNMLATLLRTFDNQMVVIPNREVWHGPFYNMTAHPLRRVDMSFGIAHGQDNDAALQLLRETAQAHEAVLEAPEPVVEVNAITPAGVELVCRPWVRTPDYWPTRWELFRVLQSALDQAGYRPPESHSRMRLDDVRPATPKD